MKSYKEIKQDNEYLIINNFCKTLILKGESSKMLKIIIEKFVSDLKPADSLEETLCAKIISYFWKLRRLSLLEIGILTSQQKSNIQEHNYRNDDEKMLGGKGTRFRSTIGQISYSKDLEDIQKQQSFMEKSMSKATLELKALQKERLIK